jgi:hypothetical protein
MGDLTGDFKNNFDDFVLFRTFYDQVHGAGALALAVGVPEPSGWVMFAISGVGGFALRGAGAGARNAAILGSD